MCSLPVLRPEAQKQGVGRATLPLEAPGAPGCVIPTSGSLSSVSVSPRLCWDGLHPEPGRSHPEILCLNHNCRDPISKAPFPGPGWGRGRLFWRPPFNRRSDSGKPLGLPLTSISLSISGVRGLALSVLGSLTFPARLVWGLVTYTSGTWQPPPAFGQILEPSASPCARPKRGTVQLTKGTGRVQQVTELMETEDLIPLLL